MSEVGYKSSVRQEKKGQDIPKLVGTERYRKRNKVIDVLARYNFS